jgi:hypothetical protein
MLPEHPVTHRAVMYSTRSSQDDVLARLSLLGLSNDMEIGACAKQGPIPKAPAGLCEHQLGEAEAQALADRVALSCVHLGYQTGAVRCVGVPRLVLRL